MGVRSAYFCTWWATDNGNGIKCRNSRNCDCYATEQPSIKTSTFSPSATPTVSSKPVVHVFANCVCVESDYLNEFEKTRVSPPAIIGDNNNL